MILDDVHRGIQKRKRGRRVGRGIGSGRGKTAGRGHKGDSSHNGYSSRTGFVGGQSPIFRLARSRDGGRTWKQEDFQYDWYPKAVTLKDGRLAIDFIEVDCMSDMPRYLLGRVGGKLREPTPLLW